MSSGTPRSRNACPMRPGVELSWCSTMRQGRVMQGIIKAVSCEIMLKPRAWWDCLVGMTRSAPQRFPPPARGPLARLRRAMGAGRGSRLPTNSALVARPPPDPLRGSTSPLQGEVRKRARPAVSAPVFVAGAGHVEDVAARHQADQGGDQLVGEARHHHATVLLEALIALGR